MVLARNANESYVSLAELFFIYFNWLLCCNQDLTKGDDTLIPEFDYQQKRRVGYKKITSASSGVVS